MALQLTPSQRVFVELILSGVNQTEALRRSRLPTAKKVKPQTLTKMASELANKPHVLEALARGREIAAKRLNITVDDLVQQLLDARQIALSSDPAQVSAAVAATMGVGKLLGLVVDKSDVTIRSKPALLPTKQLELSEDDWRRQFDPKHVTHNGR
jgi:hypothetical protein